ncbi:Mitochondrial distribution and morphology protein 31, mitochondrial precursor [Puccinia graminis f. sp. tritici]|uniref:Mitochondrial distribution and morphology protein 31, mitochondrial n=1 Tax=Puccinia graminis f. sp. tritici TaxID=56615 RepID=A0A5B0MES2_PUCGR|nr:Mitochondrial distribution and morphology protein 31, mitochondrial precursor [Puccinia graminis f. sp. tritici]
MISYGQLSRRFPLNRLRSSGLSTGFRRFPSVILSNHSSQFKYPPFSSHPHHLKSTPTSDQDPTRSTSKIQPPNPGGIQQHDHQSLIASYLPSIRSLASKLPSNLRHPPTASDLLPLTKSTLDRLHIRLKWLTIRSFHPYRTDDYSAFASLFVLINIILAAIGTTTFLGIFLFLFNKAGMEDLVARWLSNRLSNASGVEISFDSALVPRWTDGMIRFENVRVSRGGHSLGPDAARLMSLVLDSNVPNPTPRRTLDLSPLHPDQHPTASEQESHFPEFTTPSEPDPALANCTHFHLTIASIDVTLSLGRWLDGKGLLRQAEVRGVRGVIDRSHLPAWSGESATPIDRREFRKVATAGDFHLEQVMIEDLLVTIFQPSNFRPYTFSIFNATFHKLRKQWLFLDLLSAEQMAGQVDNCLFSLHKPQSITQSNAKAGLYDQTLSSRQLENGRESYKRYKTRLSRFRIDGVPIDHLQGNSTGPGSDGPLSWINSGRVDVIADIRLPLEIDELDLRTVVREIVDNFEKELEIHQRTGDENDDAAHHPSSKRNGLISERRNLIKPHLKSPNVEESLKVDLASHHENDELLLERNDQETEEQVAIELDLRFKDLKASVPIFSSSLSYVNNALVRPIVAFINANRTLIPIKCQVKLDLEEFNGSWTTYDIGLIEIISEQVYEALAYHVGSDKVAQSNRLHKVGRWGIQMTANAILNALKQHWDAAH